MKLYMSYCKKLHQSCTFHQLSCDTNFHVKKSMQGQTIKTDSPVEGSIDTIDTVRCFTNEIGIHEYNPNVSNSVLHTVKGLPLDR